MERITGYLEREGTEGETHSNISTHTEHMQYI